MDSRRAYCAITAAKVAQGARIPVPTIASTLITLKVDLRCESSSGLCSIMTCPGFRMRAVGCSSRHGESDFRRRTAGAAEEIAGSRNKEMRRLRPKPNKNASCLNWHETLVKAPRTPVTLFSGRGLIQGAVRCVNMRSKKPRNYGVFYCLWTRLRKLRHWDFSSKA